MGFNWRERARRDFEKFYRKWKKGKKTMSERILNWQIGKRKSDKERNIMERKEGLNTRQGTATEIQSEWGNGGAEQRTRQGEKKEIQVKFSSSVSWKPLLELMICWKMTKRMKKKKPKQKLKMSKRTEKVMKDWAGLFIKGYVMFGYVMLRCYLRFWEVRSV